MTPRRRPRFRFAVLALAAAGIAGAMLFLLPPATAEERAILEKVAKSQPVTTCLALRTTGHPARQVRWDHKDKGAALIRANALSQSREVRLALDLESLIDNSLKLDCERRATLSTPSFFGPFAFVEVTDESSRDIIALEKTGKGWDFVEHISQPIQRLIF